MTTGEACYPDGASPGALTALKVVGRDVAAVESLKVLAVWMRAQGRSGSTARPVRSSDYVADGARAACVVARLRGELTASYVPIEHRPRHLRATVLPVAALSLL